MNSVLTVDEIHKHYGEVQAVSSLSFSVEKGEIFGIMGPNGAGKTTSLECILGTRKADGGRVEILSMNPVKHRREIYQRVGVQFQDSSWQPAIRVGELCRYMASLYKKPLDWRGLLKKWDLEKRVDSPASKLSGGERQKLSILLATIHQPEFVVLDELTTGLDPIARRETWKMIREQSLRGTAVLMTSHYMDEVEALCSRGLILKDGGILAEGTIEELVQMGRGKNLEEAYVNLVGGAL